MYELELIRQEDGTTFCSMDVDTIPKVGDVLDEWMTVTEVTEVSQGFYQVTFQD